MFLFRFFLFERSMRLRHQHVNRRHHEQREDRADDHAADQHDTDAVSRSGTRAAREHQREVSEYRGGCRHQNRPQPGIGSANDGLQLA